MGDTGAEPRQAWRWPAVLAALLLAGVWNLPAHASHAGAMDLIPSGLDLPADISGFDRFGLAMSVDDDWMVVSSAHDYVYLYQRLGPDWLLRQTIPPPRNFEEFGSAVAIDLPWLVVGASAKGLERNGGAYVYRLDGSWALHAELDAPGGPDPVNVGRAVALDAGRIALGDPHHGPRMSQSGGFGPGAVYVYELQPDDTWSFAAILRPSTVDDNDKFGYEMAFHDETLAVAAPHREFAGGRLGEVTFYERSETNWNQVDQTDFFGQQIYKDLGHAMAFVEDRLVVRADRDTLVLKKSPVGKWNLETTLDRAVVRAGTLQYHLDADGRTLVEATNDAVLAVRNYLGDGQWSTEATYTDQDPSHTLTVGDIGVSGRDIFVTDSFGSVNGTWSGDMLRLLTNRPPVVGLAEVPELECTNGHALHHVFAHDTSDPEGDGYTMYWPPPYFSAGHTPSRDAQGDFPFGSSATTVSATDFHGTTGSGPLTVEVVDTGDPDAMLFGPREGWIHVRNLTIPFPDGTDPGTAIVIGPHWFTLVADDRCALDTVRLESSAGDVWTWGAEEWDHTIQVPYDVYPQQSGPVTLTLTATDHIGRQTAATVEYIHIGTREDVGLGIWEAFDSAHAAFVDAYDHCHDVQDVLGVGCVL